MAKQNFVILEKKQAQAILDALNKATQAIEKAAKPLVEQLMETAPVAATSIAETKVKKPRAKKETEATPAPEAAPVQTLKAV